ncbi:uracil phosphoribosyltransferase [Subsaximicrobium wynnwilliamsii]|uniref:Uracil phosphoribosyltransferase n=1 Tax=Subsaximicrobium wynnwilliamsii TaxID=291179 RepID=A0A5C6ZHN1_9FLAO|nr:uracil phosphoribosyltransferase [Subsaximicrobium wynnwilliamsii]TXD83942.1 uracil phosphoribosyltransferase [Subsaximicrobium wynnwilliamsii]TXD89682.1 uracil phosphoribosyltransferase [Subsaximicrobium wynnwilliamsii]TXE01667.1 uracil phosphoribosyltransferase [Subsaximicrobium wynnwilliamsii]
MTDFFYGIEDLFVNVLFAPYDWLRALQLDSWWLANIFSWLFILVGFAAFVYWMLQLKKYTDSGEENKSITSHSYL